MKLKGIVKEDYINYKKPSMFLIFPYCDFKCDKLNKKEVCQNSSLAHQKELNLSYEYLITNYISNDLTKAIVCGGLEPMESWDELLELITRLRHHTQDDIVIYTGFNENEIEDKIAILQKFKNIIIKFGRFYANQDGHFDEILGVTLASPNQYARRIS